MRVSHVASVGLLVIGLSGCSSLGYYAHVLQGGWQVLQAREPIAKILADPAQDEALKVRLRAVQAARRFAVTRLGLPDNASYNDYSALPRPYVLWNVFAAPELSLTPVTHCFPVAGCVAYRGYYSEALAQQEASRLRAQGFETFVGGVSAYSTLGWFDDPLLSTMLRWDDERLAATVFHELAHQRAYVPGDTAFNESYGKFVEREGLAQWRQARGLPAALPPDLRFEEIFIQRLLQARDQLQTLYTSSATETEQRMGRQAIFEALRCDVESRATAEGAESGYVQFVTQGMNNAKLLPFGLYHQWRPAFAALYAREGRDWPRFHAAVKTLAQLDSRARLQALEALAATAAPPHAAGASDDKP